MKTLLMAGLLAAGMTSLAAAGPALDSVEDLVRTRAAADGARALSLVLVDTQGQDQFASAGDTGKGRKADENSVYCVGSVSKILVPLAVLKLCEEGRMDLDAPVSVYIPEFTVTSPSGAPLTIRSLLAHESGLVSDIQAGWYAPTPEYRRIVDQLNQTKATVEPWTWYSYSNCGYSLLGVAVERAAGLAYPEFIKQSILIPWGMDRSGFAYAGIDPRSMVQGWDGEKEVPVPCIRDLPAGLFCSCASDMARLIRGLLADGAGAGIVLSPAGVAELWKIQNGESARDMGFATGLGFSRRGFPDLGADQVFWKDGFLPPYSSQLFIDPADGVGLFYAANSGYLDDPALDTGGLVRLLRTRNPSLEPRSASGSPEVPMPLALKASLVGTYQLSGGLGLVRIQASGDGLLFIQEGQEARVTSHPDGSLGLKRLFLGLFAYDDPQLSGFRLVPHGVDGTMGLALTTPDLVNLGALNLVKVSPPDLSGPWKDRLGTWKSGGAEEAYHGLTVDPGTRLLTVDGKQALRPVGDDRAVTEGWGRNAGEEVSAGSDEAGPWLRYSGVLYRKVP